MGALTTHIINEGKIHETLLWMNGKLIYKKWNQTEQSMLFNNGEIPYTKQTYLSITEGPNGEIIKTYS